MTAGRRAAQFIARTRRQLVAEFTYGDTPRYAEAKAIGACARDLFLKGEVDQVQVLATKFVNTLTQQPVCLEFLPVGEIKELEPAGAPAEAEPAPIPWIICSSPTRKPFWVISFRTISIFTFTRSCSMPKPASKARGWWR